MSRHWTDYVYQLSTPITSRAGIHSIRTRSGRRGLLILVAALALSGGSSAIASNFDCLIEPRQLIAINGPTEALIVDVKVDRGDRVAKGDVLVEFESGLEQVNVELTRYRAQMGGGIESRLARHDYARLRHQRRQELTRQNFVSKQDLDESEAEVRLSAAELREARDNRRLAELEFARAEEALRLRTLVSPIDGVVLERLMNPGEVSELGKTPILRLAEIEVLNVEVILPVQAYRLVEPGDVAIVRPEPPIGGEYKAEVTVVDQVLDASSATFGVRLHLPNAGLSLPAGIRCTVEFREIARLQ